MLIDLYMKTFFFISFIAISYLALIRKLLNDAVASVLWVVKNYIMRFLGNYFSSLSLFA